jgi:hypothetical protein
MSSRFSVIESGDASLVLSPQEMDGLWEAFFNYRAALDDEAQRSELPVRLGKQMKAVLLSFIWICLRRTRAMFESAARRQGGFPVTRGPRIGS